MPRALITMPSWLLLTRPSYIILSEYDGLRVMGEREDILWQLHTVVTGVERAGASSCRGVDGQEVPPRMGLAVADVVCRSLIVFIFKQYRCHTGLPPLSRVAAPNLKQPASIDLAVPSQLQLIYRVLIVILYHYACGSSLCMQQEISHAVLIILILDCPYQITPPRIGVDQSQDFIHTLSIRNEDICSRYSAGLG